MTELTREQISHILQEAHKKYAKPLLSGADLSGLDLVGLDFSEADLSNADLCGANLRKSKLYMAYLKGTKIDDSTRISKKWRLVWEIMNQGAVGRDLRGVDLIRANLSGADLREADLSGAKLEYTNLERANLKGANLSKALFRGTFLYYADLSEANLQGVIPNVVYNDETRWPKGYDPQELLRRIS